MTLLANLGALLIVMRAPSWSAETKALEALSPEPGVNRGDPRDRQKRGSHNQPDDSLCTAVPRDSAGGQRTRSRGSLPSLRPDF